MKEIGNGIFKTDNNNDIFMISDIHGDYEVLIHCLVDLCKACHIVYINKNRYLKWNTLCVSCIIMLGDLIHYSRIGNGILDDECSDILIIKTLLRLQKEAIKNGGKLILISGNHEIMAITMPSDTRYTSPMNIDKNYKYFTNNKFVNEYIKNTYAWIIINDILVSHGGLCSNYFEYLKTLSSSDNIIEYVNNKYQKYFINYVIRKHDDDIEYNLFINYDMSDPKNLNMFWCRQWGTTLKEDCSLIKSLLEKINCNKIIIAHCPQFLNPSKSQMINFECKNDDNSFVIARIDLGMSRCFDNNTKENFFKYFKYSFNRKMAVLKLNNTNNKLSFDNNSIITHKLSCMQYLLIKYGLTLDYWEKNGKTSNWLGFEYIDKLLNSIESVNKCDLHYSNTKYEDIDNDEQNILNIMKSFIYPVICKQLRHELPSVIQYYNKSIQK